MDYGIQEDMSHMGISGQTTQSTRPWTDVFNNKNLLLLAKEIGPKEWREVGTFLDFSRAQLDRFEMDNHGHLNAVYDMLNTYSNGSPKYGTAEQVEELASALEQAQLMNLACKVRGTQQLTPAHQRLQQHPSSGTVPVQESMRPGQNKQHFTPPSQHHKHHVNVQNMTVKLWNDERSYKNLSSDHDHVYTMKSRPRGLAVIINVNRTKGFPEREGSQIDVDLMESLFLQLHFDVQIHKDLNAEAILETLCNVGKDQMLLNSECLVVFLMGHGQKDDIFGSDGRVISLKAIFDLFHEDKCKVLSGKPKLFFIQACRGGLTDSGSTQSDGPGDPERIPKPVTSNMFFAYSSVEGYKSFRHTTEGSWFVTKIYEEFCKNANMLHLSDILTRVTKSVADKMPAGGGRFQPNAHEVYKQCPETRTTLLKSLYFFPGK